MGLITGLVTLPLAPVRGTIWLAERLLEEAEREFDDPANVESLLAQAEEQLQRGEISEDEFERIEDELLRRLIARGGLDG